ncbi:hypothetical protein M3Y97_00004100 [Aphelenchoides bicaudatus]|nr:hypothetical protein M3Y97_00004100 [Aphelenchoides bicaudatus]
MSRPVNNNPKPWRVHPLLRELGGYDRNHKKVATYLAPANPPFLDEYFKNAHGPTHNYTVQVDKVWSVNRPECSFNYNRNMTNRRLLFHGTLKRNVYPILRDGFDLDLAHECGMFGAGVYFSDCVTKAANFACTQCLEELDPEDFNGLYGYLFLCEVALGKIQLHLDAEYEAQCLLEDCHSIYGQGSHGSTRETAQFSDGVLVCPGPLRFFEDNPLLYNEFVVYSTDQIHIKYLVKIKYMPKVEEDSEDEEVDEEIEEEEVDGSADNSNAQPKITLLSTLAISSNAAQPQGFQSTVISHFKAPSQVIQPKVVQPRVVQPKVVKSQMVYPQVVQPRVIQAQALGQENTSIWSTQTSIMPPASSSPSLKSENSIAINMPPSRCQPKKKKVSINYMDPGNEEPTPNAQPFGYQQAIPIPNSDIPSDHERYKGWAMIGGACFLIVVVLVLVLTGFVKLIEFMGVYTILGYLDIGWPIVGIDLVAQKQS